ncbi:hypothetical protein S83_042049 [Arachis hypogaea]
MCSTPEKKKKNIKQVFLSLAAFLALHSQFLTRTSSVSALTPSLSAQPYASLLIQSPKLVGALVEGASLSSPASLSRYVSSG